MKRILYESGRTACTSRQVMTEANVTHVAKIQRIL